MMGRRRVIGFCEPHRLLAVCLAAALVVLLGIILTLALA
jgi:hypothetical protein